MMVLGMASMAFPLQGSMSQTAGMTCGGDMEELCREMEDSTGKGSNVVGDVLDSAMIAAVDTFLPESVPFNYGTTVPFRSEKDSFFIQDEPGVGVLCEALRKALAEADKRYLLQHTPTYEDYLIFIDSNPADRYPDQVKRYRFKVFEFNINKQHKRLMKDAKELSVNFKGSTPRWFILEQGIHPQFQRAYCYISLELLRGKKDFVVVRILSLKMGDNWYFVDELSMTVIKKEKDIRR
jgi:hypothetical protein